MRPLEVVADGCAVEHNDVDHNPRPAAGSPTGWCQLRIGRVRIICGHRGECRQGEQQQLPAVGDWYAGCTD